VVDAGWITRLFASPMFARWENNLRWSMNFFPASIPPLMPKPRIAPYRPRWWYFFARSFEGWLGSPG
jgi:hypothetical protein